MTKPLFESKLPDKNNALIYNLDFFSRGVLVTFRRIWILTENENIASWHCANKDLFDLLQQQIRNMDKK
jgi:hypothetical protein